MLASGKDGNPHYNPANLLDTLQRLFNVKNDRQLATKLDLQPPLLSKLRNKRIDAPPEFLIHLNEETNFSIRELRALMGDHRPHCGPSARHPTVEELSARRTLRVETRERQGAAAQSA
jgi:hypothetical protein